MRNVKPLELAVGSLMVALVFCVFAQVIIRYLTYQPLAWTEEAARFVFIWLSLLGAALAARRGTHFGVEVLLRALPIRFSSIGSALVSFAEAFAYLAIAWVAVTVVEVANMQRSPTSGIPMSVPYSAVPVSFALMGAYTIIRSIRTLFNIWRK